MYETWKETRFYLRSLRQEYLVICHELLATTDEQRRQQLWEWANACV